MTSAVIAVLLFAQPLFSDIGTALAQAERTYDAAAAEAALEGLEAAAAPPASEADWYALRARGLLLAAELRRIEFEQLPESAVKERRELGKVIDAHAKAGLLVVELLAETSEKYRMKADFTGVMIRSNYRAGKMKGEMKSALDEALRIDPANTKAIVSRARMLIFNPSATPAELREGQALLQAAAQRDPTLEQVEVLQAHTWERLGETEKAVEGWQACLRANPDCEPARHALAETREGESGKGESTPANVE